ncbi:hypothetical protein ZYGR_0I03150 [Zygosaccharomyces rouxii]|uniref:Histone deacetylase interacting domain-containing protein n=1 Tax=Zygosaccharomyces rouxii TaxID=4956 RepID=A0A1Q2ZX56_ZYGRO|nr:hypothetical protein ZYGR_0I03150 [Zygosaccharomyces rouxii]
MSQTWDRSPPTGSNSAHDTDTNNMNNNNSNANSQNATNNNQGSNKGSEVDSDNNENNNNPASRNGVELPLPQQQQQNSGTEIKQESGSKPHFVLPSISDLSGETGSSPSHGGSGTTNTTNVNTSGSQNPNATGAGVNSTMAPGVPSMLSQQSLPRLSSVQATYPSAPPVLPRFSTATAGEVQGPTTLTSSSSIPTTQQQQQQQPPDDKSRIGVKPRSGSAGMSVASFDNPLPPSQPSVPSLHYQMLSSQQQQEQKGQDQQQQHQQQQQQIPLHDQYYRPLNVKDALSYLEQVKFQFNSRPDVYNHFLDIMKDFKSQAIDTPGVIERVSTLFRGYPNLIQGFNTFLPQGYRIDCSQNPDEPIKVTTPMGSSTVAGVAEMNQAALFQGQQPRIQQHLQPLSFPPSQDYQLQQQQQPQQQVPFEQARGQQVLPATFPPPAENAPQQQLQHQQQQQQASSTHVQPPTVGPPSQQPQQQQPQHGSPQPAPQPTSAVSSGTGPTQPEVPAPVQPQLADQTKKAADVEFSQAISYVNKIKNRFSDQPDIYKHFLEILQTYQREQKPINEVYAQVTVLFQNAPDLLDDFKKFLPDSSASAAQQQRQQLQPVMQHQQAAAATGYGYYGENQPVARQNLPPLGSFSPPPNGTAPRDYYQEPSQGMALPPMTHLETQAAKVTPSHYVMTQGMSNDAIPLSNMRSPTVGAPGAQTPVETAPQHPQQYSPQQAPQPQLPQQQLPPQQQEQSLPPQTIPLTQPSQLGPQQEVQYVDIAVRPEIDLDPSIVPVVPEPTEPIEDSLSLVEETSFFDKAKKFIGNKQLYTEFLKILNLYSQDLLDIDGLVEKVEHYLGGSKELFTWFKNFVGYQDRPKNIENVIHEKHRLDLDMCEASGPSYKKLPKSDTFMPCSGRDEMCWEVLNDEWIGHPVWASEDSGFIAHRKNQYEETLFKVEEERHEYDFYIESNLRTIQTLETIASKIANMTEEEKANFKLPPGLGHTSLTIYKKVIRKVYDKERGFEIIDALHEHPAVAVPVVLKRLKQKDEEWRRAQREWNKVWRELEQKVYFKSLDHLGLTFKQADKKLLTTKQLISEISSIKVDQTNKRIHWLTPKPKSQLDYDFPDREIFCDILSLTEVFLNHTGNYSNSDKERLKDFLKSFLSLFFSIPVSEVNDGLRRRSPSNKEEHEANKKENGTALAHGKRPREIELPLRDILHRNKYQKLKLRSDGEEGSIGQSEEGLDEQEEVDEEEEIIKQEAKKPWLLGNIVEEANAQGIISNRKSFNLFANTSIYVFFRHLTTLYERLIEVKSIDQEVTQEINSRKVSQFAKDLNLISEQLKNMGLDFAGLDAYEQLLHLSKRLIEGDIEHQWFEESLRQAYNNRAFKFYTVDKVVQALVKHAHTILTDIKCSEIMVLFEKDRTLATTSAKDQILYRMQARSHMSNTENMFRIEFNRISKHVCIQYIAIDDLTLAEAKSLEDKWKYYVTSYSLSHPTEGISHEDLQVPFLEKIIESEQEYDEDNGGDPKFSPEGVSKSSLRIKIDPETYFLEVEPGSCDVFSRKAVNKFPLEKNSESHKTKVDKKNELIRGYLDSEKGWKKNLDAKSIQSVEEKLNFVKNYGTLQGYRAQENGLESTTKEAPFSDAVERKTDSAAQADGAANGGPSNTAGVEERGGNDTTAEDVEA